MEINKIHNQDCFSLFNELKQSSIDLILTDPPYTISKDTGFSSVKNGVKRFAVSMDFGSWDKEQVDLLQMCNSFYDLIRVGGTCIVFYDIWKITELKSAMELSGFKMLRLIQWEKSNPVPLNSSVNYLTNSREIAILGVKGGKPTFNSKYDTGVYTYPIEHGRHRFHPTQKPYNLIKDLVLKHSNKDDIVLDPFMGSGTTVVACVDTDRQYIGCEIDSEYYKLANDRINKNFK